MRTCLLSDGLTQVHNLPAFEHVNSPADPWIRFRKTSPAGALPILRSYGPGVGHSGYAWQDGAPYAERNPCVNFVDTA